ncbi:hypothetical protein ACODT5_14425 [Streptomyces sp. 5.8]|uniref:hypothetical protein n=1 Tax=Streptomyces sp. 5.8 TaxID=3406571 RepID=UPI003BB5ED81
MTEYALAIGWDTVPEGTEWPDAQTPVLLRREIPPGTPVSELSVFSDDYWHLDHAVFEGHASAAGVSFADVPSTLRLAAKHYVWQLLNNMQIKGMRRGSGQPSIRTIVNTSASLRAFFIWLGGRGIHALGAVTAELIADYLEDVRDDEFSLDRKYRLLTEVRRLWHYRTVLPRSMGLPDSPPWGGQDTKDLLEKNPVTGTNKTQRIHERTMQPLLWWAIRFVEDFSEDILNAHADHVRLQSRESTERARLSTSDLRVPAGQRAQEMTAYLQGLRERGEKLPGKRQGDHYVIDFRHVARVIACAESVKSTSTGLLAIDSGIPIDDGAYLQASPTGLLDGQPWHEQRFKYLEGRDLGRLLSTACFTVVAYLSGARPGEVLNLERGCIERDTTANLWLMHGTAYKNAVDEEGNKIPAGQRREDPWVVVEIVATAVGVLERLHQKQLLFPNLIEPYRRKKNKRRRGNARRDQSIATDLAKFVSWVNTECQRRGRAENIPADPRGGLTASRFRRTLAWFIRRRPRGLVAASIQYGHVHTRIIQGYAGTYESGFPDEYAFEDWLFRIEGITEDERALVAGERVSGPAAEAYKHRVTAANSQFAGHVLTSEGQARDLVGNPLLQIHHGEGMTCVLDPAQAACQLRGDVDDPMVTPDTDDCRPKCRNLARTDRDILQIQRRHDGLVEIVEDPLAPPFRHARDRQELERLQSILATHEQDGKGRTP